MVKITTFVFKFHIMTTILNKVAGSNLITLDLKAFLPENILEIDCKQYLFQELILKEKSFRAALKNTDFSIYKDAYVALFCSNDAIIPTWAYMLLTSYLRAWTPHIILAPKAQAQTQWALEKIKHLDTRPYEARRIVIKGCGATPIPECLYVAIAAQLQPVVQSLMYGEACSTVPLYKKK